MRFLSRGAGNRECRHESGARIDLKNLRIYDKIAVYVRYRSCTSRAGSRKNKYVNIYLRQ